MVHSSHVISDLVFTISGVRGEDFGKFSLYSSSLVNYLNQNQQTHDAVLYTDSNHNGCERIIKNTISIICHDIAG